MKEMFVIFKKDIYLQLLSKDFTFTNLKNRLISLVTIKAPIERFSVKSRVLNRGFFFSQTLSTPLIGTGKCSYLSEELFTILFGTFSFLFYSFFFPVFLSCFLFPFGIDIKRKTQGLPITTNT